MRFGNGFHNREAQAEAPNIAKAAGVGTTKAFEDAVEVLRRDAITGISNADLDTVIPPNRQLDPVLNGGVLYRVFNQGIDCQRQAVGVGIDHRLIGGTEPPLPRGGRPAVQRLDEHRFHLDGFLVEEVRILCRGQ